MYEYRYAISLWYVDVTWIHSIKYLSKGGSATCIKHVFTEAYTIVTCTLTLLII